MGEEKMNEYMPYIVSVILAIISGLVSYFTSARKSKSEISALKEANQHDLNKLMKQHKLDIDSLERKHQMEIEKMELEHKHVLELKQKELETNLSSSMVSNLMESVMQTPEAKRAMGQAFNSNIGRKRNR